MRAPFQKGTFPAPVQYGYISVGEVTEGPPERVGQTVFCLHPHQDVYDVPPEAVTPVPLGVPAPRAVLAANMETALNAVWDAQPGLGDRIVVVGAGLVGLLIGWLCARIPGTSVRAVDTNPARASVCEALGVQFDPDPRPTGDADLVVHASGSPRGLTTALGFAGLEATVLEASWFGDRSVSAPLGEAFHSRRLTLKSSQVGRIPAHRAPRWDHARRTRLALDLLAGNDSLDILITGESPFDTLPEVLERLSSDPGSSICQRILY